MSRNLKEDYILNDLNLEPIIVKAMDAEEGKGWDLTKAKKISEEYRKYLILCLKYPKKSIVPSPLVDEFWHLHILDTQKYAEDCESIFGYFLHHFPYFGMRGEEDANNLKDAWHETLNLYEENFGKPEKHLWAKSTRCPSCGRRCSKRVENAFMEDRPSLC